jgi:MFS transporter, FSR family, fosmidomycin resistance protein
VDDVYQGAVPALIPYFVRFRHLGYQDVGGIVLAATLLSSLAQPVFGLLTDRHRLHWLVPAGMTTAGVGVAASGWAGSYPLICTAVAVSGLGVAAFHPEAAKTARSASSGSHVAMSWFALSGNLGFFSGPLMVTAVVGPLGIRGTPLLAVPAVLTAAAILRRSSPGIRSGRIAPDGMSGRTDQWRPFAKLTTVVLARSVVSFGLAAFLALFAEQRTGAGPGTGDLILAMLFGGGAVGTAWGGRLAQAHSRVRILFLANLAVVPGLALLVLAPGPLLFLGVMCTGVALYIPFSLVVTLGQDYLPTHVGMASGVTIGLAVSMGGLATPLLSSIAARTSLQVALSTLLILPIGTLPLLYSMKDPLRPSDSQSVPKETP